MRHFLDARHFRELFAVGITDYSVTLDGWVHDEVRPHVPGRGTLRTVMGNLAEVAALPAEEYPFCVRLRSVLPTGNHGWNKYLAGVFAGDGRFTVTGVRDRDRADALVFCPDGTVVRRRAGADAESFNAIVYACTGYVRLDQGYGECFLSPYIL